MELKSTNSIVPHERHTDVRMILPPIVDPFQIPIEEGVELIGALWLIKIMPFLGVVDGQPVLCQPSDLLGRQLHGSHHFGVFSSSKHLRDPSV